MDILRFITAGNVDDGKSTLIGRLLHDTGNIKSDILQSVHTADNKINFAHVTDGLRTEREQGITIDVAYKYFTTQNRKYIITDAPGHFQYTRNLVTGASNVDVIIILIDALNGITEQTRRHSLVASFLRIKHIVVAMNKMDAVGFDENVFSSIKQQYEAIAEKLRLQDIVFIPLSALYGDNISQPSKNMSWYRGDTLIQYLEQCSPLISKATPYRLSIQNTVEISGKQYYQGKILSGSFSVGDTVCVNDRKQVNDSTITKIIRGFEDVRSADAGENICIRLHDGLAKRGDIISYYYSPPKFCDQFEATICWLDDTIQLIANKLYLLRVGPAEALCTIQTVIHKTDVTTFEQIKDTSVSVNEFAYVVINMHNKLALDLYSEIQENGRGILIDMDTNYTCGAFIIEKV